MTRGRPLGSGEHDYRIAIRCSVRLRKNVANLAKKKRIKESEFFRQALEEFVSDIEMMQIRNPHTKIAKKEGLEIVTARGNYSDQICIRLKEKLWLKIQSLAEANGVTPSTFVRVVVQAKVAELNAIAKRREYDTSFIPRVSAELKDQVVALAKSRKITTSELVRRVMQQAVDSQIKLTGTTD